ncbi:MULTISPECIES: hypothetical protein [Streptomyces]|uniref:Uncharacterized protein n=1 Tax=Streptomyces caniscabiei TaxID=2746961 RepID=A0ABU4MVY5_9ACTN|nr:MULTISPECIES: hypothetical protein [Streptomyces]MBE4741096.1 hypothetical protein [Streptomyces caniscabiei]MBE4760445.1 hypothetical protein [Streptomyces caniscabiei]MBE4774389.1 hypothetical protein [Streptomyces caniscabiei]MBE4789388.1 hypothetical protein [Streptomyces caniscabiei]MBE4798487.1 hypothetical protein [Streptomyces caniscabiei]
MSRPRVVAHFDITRGMTPENIALEPDGSADLTFSAARQVVHITKQGHTRVLATLPAEPNPQLQLRPADAPARPCPPGRLGGQDQTRATGLAGVDDFAFAGHGDTVLAALIFSNQVALVRPDGTHAVVLQDDGLSNRSCGLSGSESVQPRAPNGLGRAGPRRTRPRVATRILCVVLAREAGSLRDLARWIRPEATGRPCSILWWNRGPAR